MSKFTHRALNFAIIFLLLLCPAYVYAIEKPDITGYYKNLFITSRTISDKETYVYYLQRFRFDLEQKFSKELSLRLVYDNQVLLNSFYASPDFSLVRKKDQKYLAWWEMQGTIVDARALYWNHLLYRGYVRYDTDMLDCIIGKQNIEWSRMRLYRPFDLFNAVSPLDIEKDEKVGVDAVNIDLRPESFMSFNFLYAPDKKGDLQSFGLRFASKIQDYDIFLIAADIKKDYTAGLGFDGYLKECGFRGELTYTFKHTDDIFLRGVDDKDNFLRAAVEVDRSFSPKLYGILEYFYNGGASLKDTDLFLDSYKFNRQAMSITKHIAGAGLEYEISGISKLVNYVFYDFKGPSVFYNPEFRWNIRPNADIYVGYQVFLGEKEKSEYGNYHNLFYAEMKLFF
jgi:hypothetical protein